MTKREAKKPSKAAKKVTYSHPKAKFSFRRHVLPPLLGVTVMLGVAGFMNGEWITAQLMYRFAKPTVETTIVSNVHLDPKAPTKLTIPAVKVDAPVVNVPTAKNSDILMGLRDGVVQLPNGVDFGRPGKVVIFGHSSGQPLSPGNYKFVFTLLNKLEVGQRIVVDYKGTRYIYQVKTTEVVLPTDISVLNQANNGRHYLTLITCSPVGSNTHRLIVNAEQISPKPDKSAAVKTTTTPAPATNLNEIPDAASSESVWQSLRNLF